MALWRLLVVAVVVGAASASVARDELPRLTAKAAIAVDAQTGEIYYARDPYTALPPASTTKLLTAILAMRHTAPDELMRVSAHAASMPPSKAYLRAGSIYTSRDLLHALMLRSSNDASVVIAEHIGGSVSGFSRMMNETARTLGATNSRFVNPNGLPAKGHYSTVHDLAQIMRAALRLPGMRKLLSTRTEVIEPVSGRAQRIALRSTNRMLWRDDLQVIGKTGWTRAAKRCFVGAASANGRDIVIAILGSRDLWGDVELLSHHGLARGIPAHDDWRRRAGMQQAAVAPAVPATRSTARRLPAPPPSATSERRAAVAARPPAKATTQSRTTVASRGTRRAEPQGDREDLRRAQLRYHVELGAYRSRTRAQQLARDLAKRGYRAEIRSRGKHFQVVVRNFASRDAARRAAQTLGRTLKLDPVITASR